MKTWNKEHCDDEYNESTLVLMVINGSNQKSTV